MDLTVDEVLNQKLQEGKLSSTELSMIFNYIDKLIEEKEMLQDKIDEMNLNMR